LFPRCRKLFYTAAQSAIEKRYTWRDLNGI
jgi:hypothetical protein